jgi:hypothetical protein
LSTCGKAIGTIILCKIDLWKGNTVFPSWLPTKPIEHGISEVVTECTDRQSRTGAPTSTHEEHGTEPLVADELAALIVKLEQANSVDLFRRAALRVLLIDASLITRVVSLAADLSGLPFKTHLIDRLDLLHDALSRTTAPDQKAEIKHYLAPLRLGQAPDLDETELSRIADLDEFTLFARKLLLDRPSMIEQVYAEARRFQGDRRGDELVRRILSLRDDLARCQGLIGAPDKIKHHLRLIPKKVKRSRPRPY